MTFKKLLPEGKEEIVGFCIHHYDNYKKYMTKVYYAQRFKDTCKSAEK